MTGKEPHAWDITQQTGFILLFLFKFSREKKKSANLCQTKEDLLVLFIMSSIEAKRVKVNSIGANGERLIRKRGRVCSLMLWKSHATSEKLYKAKEFSALF